MTRFGHLRARPVAPADAPFLAALYASTRADLLHLPVPRTVVDAIIAHQQKLQAKGYAEAWPQAHYLVLEDGATPVGRLVLDRAPGRLRVVDLSIAPAARRRGHARAVLEALQECAGREACVLTLRVRADNPAARALYASLGFEPVEADASGEQLRWRSLAAD